YLQGYRRLAGRFEATAATAPRSQYAGAVMWNIILLVFKYGPAVVTLINELWKLWKNVSDEAKKISFKQEIESAIDQCKDGKCAVTKSVAVHNLKALRERLKAEVAKK